MQEQCQFEFCRQPMDMTKAWKKYCSDKCRLAAYWQRKFEAARKKIAEELLELELREKK